MKEEYKETMLNYILPVIGFHSEFENEFMYMEDFIEDEFYSPLMDNIICHFCKYYGIMERIDATGMNKKTLMFETIEDMINGPILK